MGEHAQKRIIRKIDLEVFLSSVKANPSPKVELEQYTISESIAATMLYLAAYTNGDIVGKKVIDLGCGTGRLALGAAFLGAKTTIGIDIDQSAIEVAKENSRQSGLKNCPSWVVGDIASVKGHFDTVVENPPFGVQKRTADRAFLEKALEIGGSIYSLHNHPEVDRQLIKQLKSCKGMLQVAPSPFLERFVSERGGKTLAVYALLMTIPRMFEFHTKEKHDFVIDLYIISGKNKLL
jgi:putative methylase